MRSKTPAKPLKRARSKSTAAAPPEKRSRVDDSHVAADASIKKVLLKTRDDEAPLRSILPQLQTYANQSGTFRIPLSLLSVLSPLTLYPGVPINHTPLLSKLALQTLHLSQSLSLSHSLSLSFSFSLFLSLSLSILYCLSSFLLAFAFILSQRSQCPAHRVSGIVHSADCARGNAEEHRGPRCEHPNTPLKCYGLRRVTHLFF